MRKLSIFANDGVCAATLPSLNDPKRKTKLLIEHTAILPRKSRRSRSQQRIHNKKKKKETKKKRGRQFYSKIASIFR